MGEWISVPEALPWWCFGLLVISVAAQFLRLKSLQPKIMLPLVLLLLASPRLQASVAELASQGGDALLHSTPASFFSNTLGSALPS
jgi:hypothetical protein